MTDPTRLLEEGATAEELRLLRAGDTEEPPAGGQADIARALGLGLASTAPAAGAAGTAAGVATKLGLKGLALLGTGLVAGAGVAFYVASGARNAPHAPTPAPAQASPSASPALHVRPPSPAGSAASDAPKAALPEIRRGPLGPASTASATPSIADEIKALDTARKAIAGSRFIDAIAALNEYDEVFTDGTLGQESKLLRIEALSKMGEKEAARKVADRFLRDHPKSPHEKRIRLLVLGGEAR